MKRIIITVIMIIMSSMALAQGYVRIDTVIRPYIQFDYQAWVDSGNPMYTGYSILSMYIPDSSGTERKHTIYGDLLQYNYIEGGADIVGLTIWVRTECGPHCQGHESEGLFPAEFLYLYDASPDTFEQKEVISINVFNPSFNGTWLGRDTRTNRYVCTDPMYNFDVMIPSMFEYQHFFDKPIHVEDSFYVGVSYNYAEWAQGLYEWSLNPNYDEQYPSHPALQYGQMTQIGWLVDGDSSKPTKKKKIRWRLDSTNCLYPAYTLDFPFNEWAPTETRDFWMAFPLIKVYDTIWTVDTPACLPVTRFGLMSRFGDTIMLRWDPDRDHSEYQISYGPEGTPPDSGTFVTCNTNRWQYIDTILSGASMVAYVRTVCSELDTLRFSSWSDPVFWQTRNSSISNAGMDNRLRLIPNPASEFVTLHSDYFISSVDIYHYGGIKHSSLAPHSHTASFSVKDWPRGLYLVVAHTPLGDITKKLVVE